MSVASNVLNAHVLGIEFHARLVQVAKIDILANKLINCDARVTDWLVWADDEKQASV